MTVVPTSNFYWFSMTSAVSATKIALDNREKKSYRVKRPLWPMNFRFWAVYFGINYYLSHWQTQFHFFFTLHSPLRGFETGRFPKFRLGFFRRNFNVRRTFEIWNFSNLKYFYFFPLGAATSSLPKNRRYWGSMFTAICGQDGHHYRHEMLPPLPQLIHRFFWASFALLLLTSTRFYISILGNIIACIARYRKKIIQTNAKENFRRKSY